MDSVLPGCLPEPELRAFHAGVLSEANCERVAAHLATCGRCAEFVGRLTAPYLLARLRDEHRDSTDGLKRRMLVACDRLTHDNEDDELRLLIEENTGYRVGAVLGSGGMGRVYAGVAKDGSGRVALKLILPRFVGVQSYLARFETEARTLRTLDHPRVVRYLKLLQVGGCPVLVMEYVAGENLHNFLRRHERLAAPEAIRHIVQLLEALQYLAGFSVVHRDVKPGNCLITETGDLKLVDFGIAKDLTAKDELTATGRFVGTPAYMSPEQSERPKEVDARSDLYSVGCVLYELLTGRPPFQGEVAAVIGAHATQPPVPPRALLSEIPKTVSGVVLRLLAKSPADRFQNAREVIAALQPHSKESGRLRSGYRRVIVGAALGLAALTTTGVALFSDSIGPSSAEKDKPPDKPPSDELLTVTGKQPFWFGSESWKDYELRAEAMVVVGDECPVIYFHATGDGFSCLRLGMVRNRRFLWFEEMAGGKTVRISDLYPFQGQPEKWFQITIKVQPFTAMCVVKDNPGLPGNVPLSRSQGRIGLGADAGGECRFRNLVVKDKAGAVLWSGFQR